MTEFLSSYGLWILLAAIFVVMHRFGMGCCGGGRRREADLRDAKTDIPSGLTAQTAAQAKRYTESGH
jgi:hypothetical protein